MAHGQNGNRLLILDFEQCHVTCRVKRNDDFKDKRIGIFGLAAGEREFLEYNPRAIDNVIALSLSQGSAALIHAIAGPLYRSITAARLVTVHTYESQRPSSAPKGGRREF